MKSSDFYLDEYKNNKFDIYEKKYLIGKNVIDSMIEDYLFEEIFSKEYQRNQKKVLEVGFFSGRITRKVKKYFSNIYKTEHSKDMIENNEDSYLFDWCNNKIDQRLIASKPFDYIISLGHQLSFSCDIDKGIKECSKLIKIKGLFIFDVWNSCSSNKILPTYSVQRIDLKKLKSILLEKGFEIKHISYGQSLFYLCPMLFSRLYSRKIFKIIFFSFIWKIEKFLFSHKILIGSPQNIICVAKRIS